MQDGTVLGISLQPYEAHIPFLLQFKVQIMAMRHRLWYMPRCTHA